MKKQKYRVVTGCGLFLIEGDLRKCRAYIKQAIQKGADPNYLIIEKFFVEVQPRTPTVVTGEEIVDEEL